jgi:hypothetical protein
MSKDILRLSQIVGTFGPGAMVDLPDRSVMISGLDNWEMGAKGAFRVIEERHLVELLEQRLQGDPRIAQGKPLSLRTPPIDPGLFGAIKIPGVPATIFPTWFTFDTVEPGPSAAKRLRSAGECTVERPSSAENCSVAEPRSAAEEEVSRRRWEGA